MKLVARGTIIEFPRRPLIMGILNLCADSFSGDGIVNIDRAVKRAQEMAREGADIIDIGAESARTNRAAMSEDEEAQKLVKFMECWFLQIRNQKSEIKNPPLVSINTWRPNVARAALAVGGNLLNDIGGLVTDENARICAATGAALLIMHTIGEPKIAHTHIAHGNIMQTLDDFFSEKIALAEAAGVARDSIILDPGIDFAKQRDDNLRIFRELDRLQKFARPILLPISRKTVIGQTLGIKNPIDRDAGTIACLVQGMLRGANIFRVHNVRAAAQAARTIDAVECGEF